MSDPTTEHEQTLWSGSVSQWHYAGKWFSVALLLAILAATFFVHLISDPTVMWIIRGVLLAAALLLAGWIRLDRSGNKYVVTNRRVTVEFGIISKQSTELRIQDIRRINLTTSGLSGLVGIGRVEFSSAASDDADVILEHPGRGKDSRPGSFPPVAAGLTLLDATNHVTADYGFQGIFQSSYISSVGPNRDSQQEG